VPNVISNRGAEVTLELTGVSLYATLTLSNPDGTPLDLTGCTLAAQIRRFPADSGEPLVDMGVTITDAAAGEATLEITDEVASELNFDRAKWDLKLTDTLGRTHQLCQGPVVYEAEVTHV